MRLARSAIQPPPSRFTASTRTRSADQALYPTRGGGWLADWGAGSRRGSFTVSTGRSEEHTSELQSLRHLVCRLLLEKKKPSAWMPNESGSVLRNVASLLVVE